mmetsp:Transcript_43921/g.78925  ORF Transcript_43921/g.78925 Transcript_43921/m.78925 type:complete len:250 (-) Transcript_43921:1623-2372(-)
MLICSHHVETLTHLHHKSVSCLLAVPEEHLCVLLVEDWIVEVCIASAHGTLAEDDLLGTPYFDDWHAPNGAALDLLRSGVHNVVGTHHQDDIKVLHVWIHFVHLENPFMRHACLCQENVHLTRHAASHWVDAKFHVDVVLAEGACELAHCCLSTSHGHAVARYHEHFLGVAEHLGSSSDAGLLVLFRTSISTLDDRGIVHAAKQHVEDVTVHSIAHDFGQDGSAEANEGAYNRQHRAAEEEAFRHESPA